MDDDPHTWSAGASLELAKDTSRPSPSGPISLAIGTTAANELGEEQGSTFTKSFVNQSGSTEVEMEVSTASSTSESDNIESLIASAFGGVTTGTTSCLDHYVCPKVLTPLRSK